MPVCNHPALNIKEVCHVIEETEGKFVCEVKTYVTFVSCVRPFRVFINYEVCNVAVKLYVMFMFVGPFVAYVCCVRQLSDCIMSENSQT